MTGRGDGFTRCAAYPRVAVPAFSLSILIKLEAVTNLVYGGDL
jgi:hypothetical protein